MEITAGNKRVRKSADTHTHTTQTDTLTHQNVDETLESTMATHGTCDRLTNQYANWLAAGRP